MKPFVLQQALRRVGLVALTAALILSAAAEMRPLATQAQAAPKEFTFGLMAPLSGPASDMGESYQRGVNLALDELNVKGVDGWKLKMIPVDHHGTALGGAQAMNQLVNLDKVPFVLTTFTGVALAAQPIAEQNSVLLLNIGGTSNNLLGKPWLYNDQIMGDALNQPLAQYVHDKGGKTVAVLTSEDAYGKDDGAAFVTAFTKLGGKIVDSETFPLTSTDFAAQLTKIRASNPDWLYIVAVGATEGLLVKQVRALDIKANMIGPLPAPEVATIGGAAADGFIGSSISVDPATTDPAAKAFMNAFRVKYGGVPTFGSGTAYEGTRYLATLIHEVVRAGGNPRNGADLLKALQAHPTFQNYLSGGQVHLQSDHGSTRALQLKVLRGGQEIFLKLVRPQ